MTATRNNVERKQHSKPRFVKCSEINENSILQFLRYGRSKFLEFREKWPIFGPVLVNNLLTPPHLQKEPF